MQNYFLWNILQLILILWTCTIVLVILLRTINIYCMSVELVYYQEFELFWFNPNICSTNTTIFKTSCSISPQSKKNLFCHCSISTTNIKIKQISSTIPIKKCQLGKWYLCQKIQNKYTMYCIYINFWSALNFQIEIYTIIIIII